MQVQGSGSLRNRQAHLVCSELVGGLRRWEIWCPCRLGEPHLQLQQRHLCELGSHQTSGEGTAPRAHHQSAACSRSSGASALRLPGCSHLGLHTWQLVALSGCLQRLAAEFVREPPAARSPAPGRSRPCQSRLRPRPGPDQQQASLSRHGQYGRGWERRRWAATSKAGPMAGRAAAPGGGVPCFLTRRDSAE